MEQQSITIQDLYEGKAEITVKFKEHEAPFSVELMSNEFKGGTFVDLPDCKVGSWTANRWFRTDKGASYEKYDSIANLKRGITASAKHRGFTVGAYEFKMVEQGVTV